MNLKFSRQIFEKYSKPNSQENLSNLKGVLSYEQTARSDETYSRLSQFFYSASKRFRLFFNAPVVWNGYLKHSCWKSWELSFLEGKELEPQVHELCNSNSSSNEVVSIRRIIQS